MHTIRLGPPWEITSTPDGTRHARKFGRPRTLTPDERVWLVCAHIPGAAEIHVNGAAVEVPTPFAIDITSLLRPRNEVIFTVASEAPIGAVVLEIRSV